MAPNVAMLTERDLKILTFLWKWKVVSTSALSQKFFSTRNIICYNRLLLLSKAKFVRLEYLPAYRGWLWTLSPKGFETIHPTLPPLREVGFKSENLSHDFLVTAFHLGEWLTSHPVTVAMYSEQQLRRVDPEYYPPWIPRNAFHRPDGYIGSQKDHSISLIPLEVELSSKRLSDYKGVAEFYSDMTEAKLILWLVPSPAFAKRLEKILNPSHFAIQKHNFVTIPSFLKSGWETPIGYGPDSGHSIRDILFKITHEKPMKPSTNLMTHSLLDLRKTAVTSVICKTSTTQPNIDWEASCNSK